MRNHILGFSDDHGKSPCVLLFGTEHGVTNNLAEFARIRAGDWPDGIVRVEMHGDDRGLESIAINTNPKPPKKTMKFKSTLSAIVALIGLTFATSAFAQSEPVYSPQTIFSWLGQVGITNGGSNAYTPGAAWGVPATQTTNGVIDCRKQSVAAYQLTFNSNTNTAMTNWLCWVPSIDGSNWDYTNAVKHQFPFIPAAAGGATCRIGVLGWPGSNATYNATWPHGVPVAGYWKLYWMSNDCVGWESGGVVQTTNIVIKSAVKIP